MFNLMSIISNFFKSKKNKTTNKLNNNRDEFIGYVFEFETGNTNKKKHIHKKYGIIPKI